MADVAKEEGEEEKNVGKELQIFFFHCWDIPVLYNLNNKYICFILIGVCILF